MIRTFWTLQSRVEDLLRKYKLTLAQFDLLAVLSARGHLSQQELADHLGVTKGNIVGLVNRLSRRGFVQRVSVRSDRRINLIRLTRTGRDFVMAALPEQLDLVAEMMRPLSSRELETLRSWLDRLEKGRDEPPTVAKQALAREA